MGASCQFRICHVSVDENRKSQSTPIILAEIAKEEGVWVTEFETTQLLIILQLSCICIITLQFTLHIEFEKKNANNGFELAMPGCLFHDAAWLCFRLSLYRGWFPVISSLCCSNFVYFYTFNTLKRVMVSDRSKPAKDLLMGFISGTEYLSWTLFTVGVFTLHCIWFKSPIWMKMLQINASVGIKMPKPIDISMGLRGVG